MQAEASKIWLWQLLIFSILVELNPQLDRQRDHQCVRGRRLCVLRWCCSTDVCQQLGSVIVWVVLWNSINQLLHFGVVEAIQFNGIVVDFHWWKECHKMVQSWLPLSSGPLNEDFHLQLPHPRANMIRYIGMAGYHEGWVCMDLYLIDIFIWQLDQLSFTQHLNYIGKGKLKLHKLK